MAIQQHVVDLLTGRASKETWIAPAVSPPTVEDYQTAIQSMVDETAVSRRYKSGDAMATYLASTVSAWSSEAQAFVAWRDDVWQYAYSELAKVQGGMRPQPTVDAFLAELPEIQWPVALAA